MRLEEIAEVLSRVRKRDYIVRRIVVAASSIAKSYKTCIIQLWEAIGGERKVLFEARNTGQYIEDSKESMTKETEYIFMEKLFNYIDNGRV